MLCRCFRFLFLTPLSQSSVNIDLFHVMTLSWHVKESSANSALPVATKMASFPEADFLPTQLQRALHCAPFPAQFLSLKNCQLVAVFWIIKQIAQQHLWQKRKSETIRSLIVHDNGDHLWSIPDNVSLAEKLPSPIVLSKWPGSSVRVLDVEGFKEVHGRQIWRLHLAHR